MKDNSFSAVFELSGLSCGSCVAKVKERLGTMAGVSGVEVTLQPPQVRLTGDRQVPVQELNAWLAPLGRYQAAALPGAAAPAAAPAEAGLAAPSVVTYRPLLILIGYLLAVVAAANLSRGSFDAAFSMRLFMGGFFVAFSFFKMLDLRGFASAYRGYDLVAATVPAWGLIYPFVELGLGLAYLADWQPRLVNAVTAVVMAVSLAGVLRAVLTKQKIRCACLGTGFNLPMSTVTIVEDGVMLAMAAAALVHGG
jgi:copper chaperone CopZ